jgi:hypothetical protein
MRPVNNEAAFLYLILIETLGRFERKNMSEKNQPLHHITASGKYRNWRKHRLQSIALGAAYKRLGVGFQKKAERVFMCSRRIDFEKPWLQRSALSRLSIIPITEKLHGANAALSALS